jgi:glucokinase
MWLAIEIGGTKLQLAVGRADGGPLIERQRYAVHPPEGAGGILRRIEQSASALRAHHRVQGVGIGFGGPVDAARGVVLKSHHIDGWDRFPIVQWVQERLGLPAVVANDCDAAALAEARFGAGQGCNPVLYVTVGTGIGGGLVVHGEIYRGFGKAAVEIGHLRPGLAAELPDETVEALGSGWGIAAAVRDEIADPVPHRLRLPEQRDKLDPAAVRQKLVEEEHAVEEDAADLLARCDRDPEALTARLVAEAARGGNHLARRVMQRATTAIGWGIAQAITLLAPQVVVVGGGVSLAGEDLFFGPLREAAARYVFPPLAGSYRIVPALLGEDVVLYGALALAAAGSARVEQRP